MCFFSLFPLGILHEKEFHHIFFSNLFHVDHIHLGNNLFLFVQVGPLLERKWACLVNVCSCHFEWNDSDITHLLCYCQNSTGVVFSREEVWEYHPIWTTPRGIARLRVGCEFHSWWYFKLNIPPKNCRNKARATPPKFHSCYDCKKRTRAYVQSSPN
jgi:hypothetical protein